MSRIRLGTFLEACHIFEKKTGIALEWGYRPGPNTIAGPEGQLWSDNPSYCEDFAACLSAVMAGEEWETQLELTEDDE